MHDFPLIEWVLNPMRQLLVNYKGMCFTTAPVGLLYHDARLCGPKDSLGE